MKHSSLRRLLASLCLYTIAGASVAGAQQTSNLPPAEPAAALPAPPRPLTPADPANVPLPVPDIKQPFDVTPPETQPDVTPDAQTQKPPQPDNLPEISPPGSPPIATGQEPPGDFASLTPLPGNENGVVYDGERGLALSQGPVLFKYGKFSVEADRAVMDANKQLASLTGTLKVKAGDQEITGRTLTYHLDTGIWELFGLEKTFPPEFFPNNSVVEDIYVTGKKITGEDERVTGQDFSVSSCDRGHYYFLCREVRFYRDEQNNPTRIVLRRNKLHVLGRSILPLPVFTIRLLGANSRRVPLQPIVGQNSYDGVFVKTTYSLGANAKRSDNLLIDLLQKRGLGLGFNRELAQGAGVFYLYALTGKAGGRQIDTRINRIWRISKPLVATINFQSTQNSQAGIIGASRNGDLNFAYNRPSIQSNVLLRMSESGTGATGYKDFGASFQHRQTLGSVDIDASTLYSRNSFGGGGESETMDNTFLLTWRQKRLDTFIRAENHDDLTGTNQKNGAYQLERLPEIGFVTDTTRTPIPFFTRYAPGNITFGLGEFNEPSSGQKLMRTSFGYNFQPRVFRLLKRGKFTSELSAVGRFEQAFYSNNTARYNYDTYLNWINQRGRFSARLDYTKQSFHGFTPFQFDFQFPGESLDASLAYRIADKFSLDVNTGQDLENNVPRDVVAQLRFSPSKTFYASLGANYARQTGEFGDIVSNLHYERPNARFLRGSLDLGVRYAAQSNKFSRINAATDLFVTRKTRIQALASYNGFSSTFDFTQIRLTRDLHCFNLYATYDQQRREFRLDLALKAFPFLDTRFGRDDTGAGFSPFFGQFQ